MRQRRKCFLVSGLNRGVITATITDGQFRAAFYLHAYCSKRSIVCGIAGRICQNISLSEIGLNLAKRIVEITVAVREKRPATGCLCELRQIRRIYSAKIKTVTDTT